MIIHQSVVNALYLRRNAWVKLQDNKGRLFWFDPFDGHYYYTNPNNKKHKKNYVARGLDDWYSYYLKSLESEENNNV